MNVGQVMTRDVVTVDMDATVGDIREIFESHKFHHVLVVQRGRVVGVISDRDLLKHISPFIGQPLMERNQDLNTLNKRAHQVMRRKPVVVREEAPVEAAAMVILDERVACLPVVDEDMRPCGIVTWRDLLMHCRYGDCPDADAPADAA